MTYDCVSEIKLQNANWRRGVGASLLSEEKENLRYIEEFSFYRDCNIEEPIIVKRFSSRKEYEEYIMGRRDNDS